MDAERGLGNAKLISSPIANVFWEGDRFQTRGISYRNDQVAETNPGDRKRQDTLPFSIQGTVIGGSVIGVPRFVRPIMTNGDGLRTMVMSEKDRVEVH